MDQLKILCYIYTRTSCSWATYTLKTNLLAQCRKLSELLQLASVHAHSENMGGKEPNKKKHTKPNNSTKSHINIAELKKKHIQTRLTGLEVSVEQRSFFSRNMLNHSLTPLCKCAIHMKHKLLKELNKFVEGSFSLNL